TAAAATPASVTIGTNMSDWPTMPDWSPDGKSVIYSLPQSVATWGGLFGTGGRTNDDHEFRAALWTVPYNGSLMFGSPSVFLPSKGENNYYPSYSPDNQFVVFDRAPLSGASNACGPTAPPNETCPND